MSVVIIVNEKWRERVPAWDVFEALPDNFPVFFQRVLDACLTPLEVSTVEQRFVTSLCEVFLSLPCTGCKVHHEGKNYAHPVYGLLL